MVDLDAIKARCEAATPSPWTAAQYDGTRGDEGWDIASPPGVFIAFCQNCGAFVRQADAEFVAHAREDIPALVAEVEQLRLALEQAQAAMWATIKEMSDG